jgi:hypothetical protein
MLEIGGGFVNYKDNGTENISISFSEEYKEEHPIFKTLKMVLVENKSKGDNVKAPAYKVLLYKPQPKEQ